MSKSTKVNVYTTCFCLACGDVFETAAALDGHQLETGHEMDQEDHPLRKPHALRRQKHTNGYVTTDGRYEVSPVFGSSIRGGDVTRPTSWCLKDRQGEFDNRTRPLLSDIRDILKERP